MKRFAVIAVLTLAAAAVTFADRYAPANGSSVKITGTSTLHIKSEHGKMDKLMAEALKANANPEIRFEMIEAKPATMTDFRITPPAALFGAIKASDQLTVSFDLTLQESRS